VIPPVTPLATLQETLWTEKARLSRGVIISSPLFSPDGTKFAIPTSNGIYVYETHTWGEPRELKSTGMTCVNPCALAFSPDGKWLASAYGNNLWIWAGEDGDSLHTLDLDLDASTYITSLEFSPDGARLAAGYRDASASSIIVFTLILQTSDWKSIYTIEGADPLFSPDNQAITTIHAGVEGNSFVFLYTADKGQLLHRWDGKSASFLPTGELLVEANDAVRVLDPRAFTTRLVLNGSTPALSPDGETVAVTHTGGVHLYSLEDGALLSTFALPQEDSPLETVESLLFSPNGSRVAANTTSRPCPTCEPSPGPVILWNSEDGSVVDALPAPADQVWLRFAPDGNSLAVVVKDGVKLYDPASGALIDRLDTFSDYTGELALSPDGKRLAVGYGESFRFGLRVWEVATRKEARDYVIFPRELDHSDWWKMAFSPDNKLVGLGSNFWEIETGEGQPLLQQELDAANPDMAISLAFDPRHPTIALGFPRGDLQLWSLDRFTLTQKLESGITGDVISLAYSPDGAQLAAAYAYTFEDEVHASPAVQVWQMPAGAPLYRLAEVNIFYVTFSPDGQRLATISTSSDSYDRVFPYGVVQLWTNTGEYLTTLPPTAVMRLAFSPDGQILATGLSDGRVQLWNLEGRLIQELDTSQEGVITGLAFSQDGNLLAIATGIGVIELWGR
jgi:WD40 repeat protein